MRITKLLCCIAVNFPVNFASLLLIINAFTLINIYFLHAQIRHSSLQKSIVCCLALPKLK